VLWFALAACTPEPARLVVDTSFTPPGATVFVVDVLASCSDPMPVQRFVVGSTGMGTNQVPEGPLMLRARAIDASCHLIAESCDPWVFPVAAGTEIRLTPRVVTPTFLTDCIGALPDGGPNDAGTEDAATMDVGGDVDCNTPCYGDFDRDGYPAFGAPVAYACTCPDQTTDREPTDVNIDCDDANAEVHPGAPELCDGVDGDCDGSKEDEDFDGALAPDALCTGGTLPRGDCNDSDDRVHPGANHYGTPYCTVGIAILCGDEYRCNDCSGALATEFDYDCDGEVTPKPPGPCRPEDCPFGSFVVYPQRAETVDRCGQHVDVFFCMDTGGSCEASLGTELLPCR
jgi:hypothetical protein